MYFKIFLSSEIKDNKRFQNYIPFTVFVPFILNFRSIVDANQQHRTTNKTQQIKTI
jgi:hypothetical protein